MNILPIVLINIFCAQDPLGVINFVSDLCSGGKSAFLYTFFYGFWLQGKFMFLFIQLNVKNIEIFIPYMFAKYIVCNTTNDTQKRCLKNYHNYYVETVGTRPNSGCIRRKRRTSTQNSCERKVLQSGNHCRHLWHAFVAALLVAEGRTQFHLERLLLPIPVRQSLMAQTV